MHSLRPGNMLVVFCLRSSLSIVCLIWGCKPGFYMYAVAFTGTCPLSLLLAWKIWLSLWMWAWHVWNMLAVFCHRPSIWIACLRFQIYLVPVGIAGTWEIFCCLFAAGFNSWMPLLLEVSKNMVVTLSLTLLKYVSCCMSLDSIA